MKLDELLKTILGSTPEQWNTISCWGYGSGPSYKDKFVFYEVYNGQENVLHADSHSNICVFKDDVDITMAYGIVMNDDYKEDWANKFANSSARSKIIDIFYRGSLVVRETYVAVDGGRCELPIPNFDADGKLSVARDYYKFIKLIGEISRGSNDGEYFEQYFKQTEIKISEEKWII